MRRRSKRTCRAVGRTAPWLLALLVWPPSVWAAEPLGPHAVDVVAKVEARVKLVGAPPGGVTRLGDVNADGVADYGLAVGNSYPNAVAVGRRKRRGKARARSAPWARDRFYVVFGRRGSVTVDVRRLGNGGFRVDGLDPPPEKVVSGIYPAAPTMAGAGDVNRDGLEDIAVSSPTAGLHGRLASGSTWVVFGRRGGGAIDLRAPGATGYRIDGARPLGSSGNSLAPAGDVNGDGRPDLLMGTGDGSAYVVFGRAAGEPVDLARLGDAGDELQVTRALSSDQEQQRPVRVASAGDVNGDGLADVAVGASESHHGSSAAWVFFGQQAGTTFDLADLGARGY